MSTAQDVPISLTEAEVMAKLNLKPWDVGAADVRAQLNAVRPDTIWEGGIRCIGTTTWLIVQAIVAASEGGPEPVRVGTSHPNCLNRMMRQTYDMAARCDIAPERFHAIDIAGHERFMFHHPGVFCAWDGVGAALHHRYRINQMIAARTKGATVDA